LTFQDLMKYLTKLLALSVVATATQAEPIDRTNVLAGISNSGNNPEKFATQLLQAQQADVSPACADMTGYEHCAQCAKPALASLVTELVKVKPEPGPPPVTVRVPAPRTPPDCSSACATPPSLQRSQSLTGILFRRFAGQG
jgi:hypothetical protein